ncbi:MAG TPA: YbjQ family protein, partial [Chroococcales cyanobacterium]
MMTRSSKIALVACAIAFGAAVGGITTPAISGDNLPVTAEQTGTQSPLLVTTTQSVDGYRIVKYLGVVRGVTVRQPTMGQSFKASIKGIVGGKIGPYVSMCETARQYAYDLLVQRATQMGANAIIGMRYDAN